VASALEAYGKALSAVQNAQKNLQSALLGKQNNRCLFTNAVPVLGDLQLTLAAAGALLGEQATNMKALADGASQLIPLFKDLAGKSDLSVERTLMKQVEKDRAIYEKQLIAALKVRKRHTDSEISAIVQTRSAFELGRFDLVRQLNCLDSEKKIRLTHAACALSELMGNCTQKNTDAHMKAETILQAHREMLPHSEETMSRNDRLWDGMRERLRGELVGALPPPGAPLGALSIAPNGPVGQIGCNLFSINIFTEVLSARTRTAKITEFKQATAEGIYKQGYLITESKYLGARSRRWFRLFGTKLYKLDMSLGGEFREVCDVYGAAIEARPGSVPHKIVITTKSEDTFVFQAENNDNAMMWIWALRRCGAGGVTESSNTSTAASRSSMRGMNIAATVDMDTDPAGGHWLIHNGPGQPSRIANDADADAAAAVAASGGAGSDTRARESKPLIMVKSADDLTLVTAGTGAAAGAGAGTDTDEDNGEENGGSVSRTRATDSRIDSDADPDLHSLTEIRGRTRTSSASSFPGAGAGAGAGGEDANSAYTAQSSAYVSMHQGYKSAKKSRVGGDVSTSTGDDSDGDIGENNRNDDERDINNDDALLHIRSNSPGGESMGATVGGLSDNITISDCTIVFGAKHSDLNSRARALKKDVLRTPSGKVVRAAGPNAQRVESFLEKYPFCAECGAVRPVWVSINYGISLCEDCAGVHTRLGSTISKLRHVLLDDLSDWQCDLLLEHMGNPRVLQVMEASVPAGWIKPQANSSLEDKWAWCDAKYRWYAFVSDGSGSLVRNTVSDQLYRQSQAASLQEFRHMTKPSQAKRRGSGNSADENANAAIAVQRQEQDDGSDNDTYGGLEGSYNDASEDGSQADADRDDDGDTHLGTAQSDLSAVSIPVGIRDSLSLQIGLMEAVKKGHVLGALWWLVHRADVNALYPARAAEGRSPLHEAVAHGRVSMVAFLCLNGADIYQQDGRGNTALSYVEGNAFTEIPAADRKAMQRIFINILRVDC